ncbi:hypothetical protein T10_8658 [Trichinella papuae]|uniref:Uncharacterized protein n=1 Tax=Trichinella papuae TaxID=268474 RepID=A0A0V1MAU1_9BILA|nr:hypothetical protein T10_8658 [Trichinella papuae]
MKGISCFTMFSCIKIHYIRKVDETGHPLLLKSPMNSMVKCRQAVAAALLQFGSGHAAAS